MDLEKARNAQRSCCSCDGEGCVAHDSLDDNRAKKPKTGSAIFGKPARTTIADAVAALDNAALFLAEIANQNGGGCEPATAHADMLLAVAKRLNGLL